MGYRVAAIQLALGKASYSKTISDAKLASVSEAAKNGARIVCLPEHWLLEYRDEVDKAIEELSRTAKESEIFIVTGANYTNLDNGET